jgi:hypothetical protein
MYRGGPLPMKKKIITLALMTISLIVLGSFMLVGKFLERQEVSNQKYSLKHYADTPIGKQEEIYTEEETAEELQSNRVFSIAIIAIIALLISLIVAIFLVYRREILTSI